MACFDKYGVEFSDDRKTLVKCPEDFQGEYVIPNSVTSIGDAAFEDCYWLINIEIPNSVTSIGDDAFRGCSKLTSLKIPYSVVSIGDAAIWACPDLASIVVEEGNSTYDSRNNCNAIIETASNTLLCGCRNTSIPNSVTSIGHSAFSKCFDLTSIEIPDSVTSIGDHAFSHCTDLTSVTIPNSVTSIGKNAFSSCSGLAKIEIPNSVTSIGNEAFSYCSGLTKIEIPNSVTSIGNWAFHGCSGLTSVIIPNSVTSIGEQAFDGCSGLTKIIVEAGNTKYDSRVNCNAIIETSTNTLIAGCKSTIIPNSVTSIGEYAFCRCSGLTSIEIPNSVTNIGSYAFQYCSGLTSVTIPNSVTTIENGTFADCSGLTGVTIPNSVTSIGHSAFSNCFDLTSIEIPDTVTSIGCMAFENSGLTSIEIPNSVTSIGWRAFYKCFDLKEIVVPINQKIRFAQQKGLEDDTGIIIERESKSCIQARQRRQEKEVQRRIEEQQLQEMLQDSILFFDTETTGVPRLYNAPVSNSANWPRLVQIAWLMADKSGNILKRKSVILKPDGFNIPQDASAVHGITTERAQLEGQPLDAVLEEFMNDVQLAAKVVGHNIDFDMHIVGAELYRLNMDYDLLMDKPCTCTMKSSTDFCAIPSSNSYFGGYKWPSLQELYRKLFNRDFTDAHDALADITATKECFFELKQRGVI